MGPEIFGRIPSLVADNSNWAFGGGAIAASLAIFSFINIYTSPQSPLYLMMQNSNLYSDQNIFERGSTTRSGNIVMLQKELTETAPISDLAAINIDGELNDDIETMQNINEVLTFTIHDKISKESYPL